MATKVIMPKQGLQMTEGTITKWLIEEGGVCKKGEPLFEMETDKLSITMDAPADGTLLKIIHGEFDVVPITKMIAVIGDPGEDIADILKEASEEANENKAEPEPEPQIGYKQPETSADAAAVRRIISPDGRKFSTPRARMRAEERNISIADIPAGGPDNLVTERDVLSFNPALQQKASHLAKAVAAQENVALADVRGTGAHGRIMKSDVQDDKTRR